MFTQDVLRAELARRVHVALAGPDAVPEDVPGMSDLEELAARQAEAPDLAVIAVLREFDPVVFARSSVEFALGLQDRARTGWLRAFTRTVFLVGNPANLAERFPFDHVAPDGSMAWLGPASREASTGLRRLLKRFDGDGDAELPAAVEFAVPGPPARMTLNCHVATAGVSLSDYLVHVNHVLAEAVLTGAIRPGHRVVLTHAPRLVGAAGPYSVLRVHRDGADPTRLRAYAGLSTRPYQPVPR